MKKLIIILVTLCYLVGIAHSDTYEVKYNTSQWVPVILLDGTDGITPKIGVSYTGISMWYKQGIAGTWSQLTLVADACTTTSGNWCQEDSVNVPGSYRIYIPSTIVGTKGKLMYTVSGTGIRTFWGLVSVIANTAAEDPVDAVKTQTDKLTNVTTTNANLGTTQPVNFTGTGGTAYVKSDAVDVGGTAQTARDIGASVLLSSGTGTGQISLSSGAVLLQPTQTGVTIPTVTTITNAVTLPTIPSNWITSSGITDGAISGAEVAVASVTVADITPGADTKWHIQLSSNSITANGQYTRFVMRCGNEVADIINSSDGSPDYIDVNPNLPFITDPDNITCFVQEKR